jgi:hypothetical protein
MECAPPPWKKGEKEKRRVQKHYRLQPATFLRVRWNKLIFYSRQWGQNLAE